MQEIQQLKRLYDLGFSLHLLRRKSKLPLETGWSGMDRVEWDRVEQGFKNGLNVGVRLGSASSLNAGFVSVLDCDIKSEDPRHRVEMEKKLSKIFPTWNSAPAVLSGRGQGSMHVYCRVPVAMRGVRLAQSPDKVKVKMPSVSPSRYERDYLTPDEIKAGLRYRPAWEISFMGTGQQVVLPPSVHPDTGRKYEWKLGSFPKLPRDFPFFEPPDREGTGAGGAGVVVLGSFAPIGVDLVGSALSSRVVDMIVRGDGVDDRSAALLSVCHKMLRARMTEQEILSVLTDQENFLGVVAYDHANTKNRARAAEWIQKYTLARAKKDALGENAFDGEIVEAPQVDARGEKKQLAEIARNQDWDELLDRTEKGVIRNTLKNVLLILREMGGKDVFRYDEFKNAEIYGYGAPWGGKKGEEIRDGDVIAIKEWLADHFKFEPSNDRINEAICRIADRNRFHPVRQYLDGLKWDGKLRVDHFLRDYLGASAREPYLSAISRKWLTAMVKRIYEPGCKFDQVVILEGNQGIGKSTALRSLVGDAWFTDATLNVADKDAVMNMRSVWLVELGELSGLRAAEVDLIKEFISRTTDRIRVPYGKRSENFPRQCVFVGTTNRQEYLKDPTGNRRFWPVSVGRCDFEKIRADRDQIFAEAVICYREGEPLYLEDPKMAAGAYQEQENRAVSDVWEEMISEWLQRKTEENKNGETPVLILKDLFDPGGPLCDWKPNIGEMKRAGDALRRLKWEKKLMRFGQTVRKVWFKGDVTPM